MSRCIALAKNGTGTTHPNPLVGSVIVHNDTIIGEGWHRKAGEPHAEVNAINNAKKKAKGSNPPKNLNIETLFTQATIYVSLEPCSHYGKTPPCADLIIASGIKKVIIGSTDPNPKVAGKGIIKLIEAGCEVQVGILEDACNELNKRFFTFQNKKRPYIILKWAQTNNGLIAPSQKATKAPVWISNPFSKQWSHRLRAQEQAILVGTNTIIDDNPSLTTRDYYGKNPTRIIIDRDLKLPEDASVFNEASRNIVLCGEERPSTKNTIFEVLKFQQPLAKQVAAILYKHQLQSVIVEGGARTLQTFIDENLWDEAWVFTGKGTFETGIKAPVLKGIAKKSSTIKDDLLTIYTNTIV